MTNYNKLSRFCALLCVLCALTCALFMTACAGKKQVYKIEKLIFEMSDQTIEVGVGETFNGFTLTENYFTVVLNGDGTSALHGEYAAGEGTWQKSGDQIIITIEGEAQTFTVSGNKLIMEAGAVEAGLKYTVILAKK